MGGDKDCASLSKLRAVAAFCLLNLFQGSCLPSATLSLYTQTEIARHRWVRAICVSAPRDRVVVSAAPLSCGTLDHAWGCHTPGLIQLATDTPPDKKLDVLTHEFGHTLMGEYVSPDHTAQGCGIMAPRMENYAQSITRCDLALVCSTIACGCEKPELESSP